MSNTQAISAPSDGKASSTQAKKSAPNKIATVPPAEPVAKPRRNRAPACATVAEQKTPGTSVSSPPNRTPQVCKQDQLAALLLRDEGATLDQMISAMGWLPHTTRAALTGLRKKGYAIDSDKVDGVRTYRGAAPR